MKNLINFLKLFVILFIFPGSLIAQVTQEWVKLYTGQTNTGAGGISMVIDGSGNVYVTGTVIISSTNWDFMTIKYNTSGVQQWVATYNGPGNGSDMGQAIAVDSSGNVYVSGPSTGSGTSFDYCTIKYNSSGAQQWVSRYNGPGNDSDNVRNDCIAVDGNGNVYITGTSVGNGTGFDICTIKYNSSGIQQWVIRYDGPGYYEDGGRAIALDASGNIYVTGDYDELYSDNYCTFKFNPAGVQQWMAIYNGPDNLSDWATDIAVDGSGNVYVTGQSFGYVTQGDYCTIKYNNSGVQQWVARYDWLNYGEDQANSIAVDAVGNVYVTGHGGNLQSLGRDYCTIIYNSSGVQQWTARHNGPGDDDDEANSIVVDAAGNVYVTGESEGIGTKLDYCTIKYNSSGVQQWLIRYTGPGNDNDNPNNVAIDGSGNVYVAGVCFGTTANSATIKYSQQIGVQNISSEIPSSFSLSQNYPNPFNPSTKIKFDLPESEFITMKIFDALGREVATLVNEQLIPGTYEAEFNGANYPSDVYFYRLTAGDFSETKKMLMIK